MCAERDELMSILQNNPNDPSLQQRIASREKAQVVDITRDLSLLKGVWELRWSSSSKPWLRQTDVLENLQALDPDQKTGFNLLRLRGPCGVIGCITVQAELSVVSSSRVEVRFIKGGWVGPKLYGFGQLKVLRDIQQSFPAWLDITYLDSRLRICRGNAGTLFALLRRETIQLNDFKDQYES